MSDKTSNELENLDNAVGYKTIDVRSTPNIALENLDNAVGHKTDADDGGRLYCLRTLRML